jgi:hypothetical protein
MVLAPHAPDVRMRPGPQLPAAFGRPGGARATGRDCWRDGTAVPTWTGDRYPALREARRRKVAEFATYLRGSDRLVSTWESGGQASGSVRSSQDAPDSSLERPASGGVGRSQHGVEAT